MDHVWMQLLMVIGLAQILPTIGLAVLLRRIPGMNRRLAKTLAASTVTLVLVAGLNFAGWDFPFPTVWFGYPSCINNLRQIDGAKEQWALETKATTGATPSPSDLYGPTKYIKVEPGCDGGGSYTIGTMANLPACSLGTAAGHTLVPEDLGQYRRKEERRIRDALRPERTLILLVVGVVTTGMGLVFSRSKAAEAL